MVEKRRESARMLIKEVIEILFIDDTLQKEY